MWADKGNWITLNGANNMSVRTKPMSNGKFMWQFRKTVSYANTLEQAIEYVEAGAEYFETMRTNPYK